MIELRHDERAQMLFALALNRYVQATLAEGSRRVCEDRVVPELGLQGIREPRDRQRLRRRMEDEPLHRYWLAMMQVWQDLLWGYSGDCVDRQLDDLVERCRPKGADRGTLRLDPTLSTTTRYPAAIMPRRGPMTCARARSTRSPAPFICSTRPVPGTTIGARR
jgi:hypothetical protein